MLGSPRTALQAMWIPQVLVDLGSLKSSSLTQQCENFEINDYLLVFAASVDLVSAGVVLPELDMVLQKALVDSSCFFVGGSELTLSHAIFKVHSVLFGVPLRPLVCRDFK